MELNNGTEEKEQFRKREAAIKLLADGLRGDWGDHHPVYGDLAGGKYLGSTQMLLEKMANLLKTTAFCLYLANSLTTF